MLVPDCRGLDQNFHDVTIVDMGDLPESHVSMPELAELIHKWPLAVINHMMWRKRELEQMCKAAKMKYRQKHPAPCTFCGTIIKCDMYRHVARRHLELAQLWRCPVPWCTIWRGTPQDLMDHIRDAHNVPGEIRKVSLEMLFPPWTVTRQVYVEEDVDLAQVLADFGALPAIVTPIRDPQREQVVPPAEYREPDVQVGSVVVPAGPTVMPANVTQPPTPVRRCL